MIEPISGKENSPLPAIRAKCVDCSGGSPYEVKKCQVFDCPLWSFRIGQRPNTVMQKNPELLDPEAVAKMADE